MSTKVAVSSRNARHKPRRPSKLALMRIKVVTIVTAVILFFASLMGIALYNPGISTQGQTQTQAPAPAPVQHITILQPNGSNVRVIQPPANVTGVRPFVRSRGS